MRVVVTGDRYWFRPEPVFREMDALLDEWGDDLQVIEGCAHGLDELVGFHEPGEHQHGYFAGGWAWLRGLPERQWTHVPAPWKYLRRGAGPVRNRSMLARNPDLCLAFHEDLSRSSGTADMIRAARGQGVPVKLITA